MAVGALPSTGQRRPTTLPSAGFWSTWARIKIMWKRSLGTLRRLPPSRSLSYDFLGMLIDIGVNIKHVNRSGSTLLHWTARSGDCRLSITLAARKQLLRSFDTAHRDGAGKPAREVLQNRVGKPDGFEDDFERFISSLEELQMVDHNSD